MVKLCNVLLVKWFVNVSKSNIDKLIKIYEMFIG